MSKIIYDVWSDGSYREGKSGPVAGAGYVIENDGAHYEHSVRLSTIPKEAQGRGSDIAELQAVTRALSAIPQGSNVRLRMDCQNVIDWLQSGQMKGKSVPPYLTNAFTEARKAVVSMERVEFIKASDRNNANMKRTNDLARTASSPNF